MENETREYIRDYLNGTDKENELLAKFDLKKCQCGNYELSEDMVYQKHDIGEVEEQVCESCRNNE